MSEFVEIAAEESEGDGEEMEDEEMIQKKKTKAIQIKEEEEEEDEDDADDEAVKDFIDDNPVQEDEESDDESKKRKNSDDEDELPDRLDDDDYDLIEENIGVKVQRRKYKRLRRIEDEDSDREDQQNQGDDREAIARKLFDGSDSEEATRWEPGEGISDRYGSEESDADSEDYFIVDDDGRPVREGVKKRKRSFTEATLQKARDIFGVGFDYDEFQRYEDEYDDEDEDQNTVRRERRRRKTKSMYEIYEPHELERAGLTAEDNKIRNQDIPERMQLRSVPVTSADDEELDEEAEWIHKVAFFDRVAQAQKEQSQNVPETAVPFGVAEPDWDDNWDKQTTVPAPAPSTVIGGKRQGNWVEEEDDWGTPAAPQTASAPIPRPAATAVGDDDWDQEDWSAPAKKTDDKMNEELKALIISKVRKALEFMRNQLLEAPFIAFYRKEYVQPELSINDLWTIYRLDEKFCQLKLRKGRLTELFKNMRVHQKELMSKSNNPISQSMRLITDVDLERIHAIKTSDELKDMYQFFSLYYGDEVYSMKETLIRKREEERQFAQTASVAATGTARRSEGEAGEEPISQDGASEEMGKDGVLGKPRIRPRFGGGAYYMYKKLGVDSFVRKFGLSSEQFAENLLDNCQRHEVEQYPTNPLEAAKDMCCPRLKEPEEVLKASKFMMATQISREPIVRQCVREVFFERATISCCPTKKGQKEIDEAHPCFTMKYLKDKPVQDLKLDQFLKLILAEKDGLLTITLGDKIHGITTPDYIEEVKELFMKDEFSKNVQDWNTLRGECIEFAFENLLYPVLRKELRTKLLEAAKDHVLQTCSNKLYNFLKTAPYKVNFVNQGEEWDSSRGIRILAIAYVPDYEEASFACLINTDGEPSDYISLRNMMKRKNANRETDRQEKEADLTAIKIFISTNKPHLIVIGGESREALMIQQDVKDVVSDLSKEEAFPYINVEIIDNQLAKVYANSTQSSTEFREYPLLLKQAVSLGRRMQDPLIEFSQLCTPDEEILCFSFHPLQDHVSKEELLEKLYIEFINRTNEVGVDVNRAIAYPYTSNVVQFTCGLGPRKAAALLNTLKKNDQRLENRSQLITCCNMGSKVFINCSGFIKIDTNSLGDSTESYVEMLDGSRVHPEAYEWARKMAIDALDYGEGDERQANAVEEILESPEKLECLELDAFADELEKQGFGNKSITLYDIHAELNQRYRDLRLPYESLEEGELFNMLTKETPDTLHVGKLIIATVSGISYKKPEGETLDKAIPIRNDLTGMWQCAFCGKNDLSELAMVWDHFDSRSCPGQVTGVRLRLDNGMSGFIPISKLSDAYTLNPEERVKRNQALYCRITKIDVPRYSVECTSRTSDLNDIDGEWAQEKDRYYDHVGENKDKKAANESWKRKQTSDKITMVHPNFKDVNYQQTEGLLETMPQGEVILRPSSKGREHLTITWKVADGVNQHIDVLEAKKESGSNFEKRYWVGSDEFESIDEILVRFVAPMASHARDIIGYKYYVKGLDGNRFKADQWLLKEKAMNAGKIHYVFHPSKDFPGKFMLSYLPRLKSAHEFVTVTPVGFRYRQKIFETLDHLLKWFKVHYRDPPVTPTASAFTSHSIQSMNLSI